MANFTLLLGAFVALHLLFANDPARARLVATMGENGFRAFYTIQSLVLLGGAILFYRQSRRANWAMCTSLETIALCAETARL